MDILSCGFQRLTSSGSFGDSGKSVLFCGYSVDANGSAATAPVFYNGTSAILANTAYACITTAINTSTTQSLPIPLMLFNGGFVAFDAGTAAVTVFYVQMSTS